MKGLRKVHTPDLTIGDEIRPFGVITHIEEGADRRYIHFNGSSNAREFKRRTKWWVEDKPARNERKTRMVSHRRQDPSDTNPYAGLSTDDQAEAYARLYRHNHLAAEKALESARTAAGSLSEGTATLYLHEATVYAQLAQAAATMASAVTQRGTSVELRAVTD